MQGVVDDNDEKTCAVGKFFYTTPLLEGKHSFFKVEDSIFTREHSLH